MTPITQDELRAMKEKYRDPHIFEDNGVIHQLIAEIERLQAKVLTDCEEDRLIEFWDHADDGSRFAALCQFAARCGELRTEIERLQADLAIITASHRGKQ